ARRVPARPAPARPVPARPAPAPPVLALPVPRRPAPAPPVPARPAPARPVPARPVPARPVPARPVPALPVPRRPAPAPPVPAPARLVPAPPVPARPVPSGPWPAELVSSPLLRPPALPPGLARRSGGAFPHAGAARRTAVPAPASATSNRHPPSHSTRGRRVSRHDRRRAEGRYQHGSGPQREDVRRRPTLPRGPPRSTIGAEGLNFRVRNGTGCFPFAMATETLWRCQVFPTAPREPHSGREQNIRVEAKPLGLLVPVSYTRCRASTSGLSTQSSSWGPYQVNPEGVLILRRASRLDAFSGYPFRT